MYFTPPYFGSMVRTTVADSLGVLNGISLDDETNEWAVDRIVNHYGRRSAALFEILWKSGDKSCEPGRLRENIF